MQRRKYKQQMLESDRHTDIQTGSTGILRDRLCRWDNERKDLTSLPLRVSWFIEKICFLFLSKNLFFFTVKRWASYFWRRKEIIVFKMENRHCSLNGHVLQTVCPCCQPCVWTLLFSLAVNRSHGSCSLLFFCSVAWFTKSEAWRLIYSSFFSMLVPRFPYRWQWPRDFPTHPTAARVHKLEHSAD